MTHFGSRVSSPTPEDLSSSKSVVSTVAREKRIDAYDTDFMDNPELAQMIGQAVADAAKSTIASLLWTLHAGLPSLAHPAAATGAGVGKKFVDTGLWDTVANSNKLTAALSASSLASARSALRAYKNQAGLPCHYDLSNANLALVVPPALETTGRDLVGRGGEVYDGTGLQSGSFGGMDLVVNPYASDDGDYSLIVKSATPLFVWIRQAPVITVERIPGTSTIATYSKMEVVAGVEPFEGGIVYSVVA